jgi:hypothetical protein
VISTGSDAGLKIELRTNSPGKGVEEALSCAKSADVDTTYIASTPYLLENAPALVAGATRLGVPVIGDEQGWPEAGALILGINVPQSILARADEVIA